MPKGIFMVFTHCTDPDREEEYNRWYTHTHLPDLSAAKGFVTARRFRNANPGGPPDKYLAIYEFNTPDLKESIADLIDIAIDAHATGRHIDFIQGGEAFIFEEIDPGSLQPSRSARLPNRGPRADSPSARRAAVRRGGPLSLSPSGDLCVTRPQAQAWVGPGGLASSPHGRRLR